MTIFTGDHSAVYSLACAVACIACSFALITWYNKMMNDPYGRLDVRAVIKAVIILFLTCNFYSFVLVPFDHITYLVTRGLSASVDERHMSSCTLEEMVREIEDSRGEETFFGNFMREMENEQSTASDDSGISGNSSAVLESEAEVRINDRPRKPFGQRFWQAIKDTVSGIFAECPECHEKYDLGCGYAVPQTGISHEAMRALNVIVSDGKLTITQKQ